MKKLSIVFLCVLLLLSGCASNTSPPLHVMFDPNQVDSQIDCIVPNKKVATDMAEAIFRELPLSVYAKTFEVRNVDFDDSNDSWIVYFGQPIPWKNILTGEPLTAGYDIFIAIQQSDGAILKIGMI